MAKIEQRPVDAGLAEARGKDEASAVEWWKQRFALIAAIPTEVARAGALLPQMRELSRLPDAERRSLTRARMLAFMALPGDQRQAVMTARKLTYAVDPELVKSDDAVAEQLAADIPGAKEFARREFGEG